MEQKKGITLLPVQLYVIANKTVGKNRKWKIFGEGNTTVLEVQRQI